MQQFSVREANLDDIDALIDMTMAMVLETEDMHLEQGQVREAWRTLFHNPKQEIPWEEGKAFLQCHGGEVVGMMRVSVQSFSMVRLRSIYIKPNYRGQGHFKSLWKEVLQLIREKNVKEITLGLFN